MESVEVLKKADRKLTFIPVLFILLRMWGTIRFFRFLACLPDCHHSGPQPAYRWLEILHVSMQPLEMQKIVLENSSVLLVCRPQPLRSEAPTTKVMFTLYWIAFLANTKSYSV